MLKKGKDAGNHMTSPLYKLVLQLIGMQLLAVFFTLLIFLSVGSLLGETWTAVVCTVIGAYMYGVFIYANHWSVAERDRNLVLYGHIRENLSRGLRSGLYAVAPTLVVTLLAIIQVYTGVLGDGFLPMYRVWMLPFIGLVNLFVQVFPPLLLLLCGVAPFFAWLGYRNGYHLKHIFRNIVYEKGDRRARPRNKRAR